MFLTPCRFVSRSVEGLHAIVVSDRDGVPVIKGNRSARGRQVPRDPRPAPQRHERHRLCFLYLSSSLCVCLN